MIYTQPRLEALIRAAADARKGPTSYHKGTQEYLLGFVYGLANTGSIDENMVFKAQQFIASKGYAQPAKEVVSLYDYPSSAYTQVEGRTSYELEQIILAGGPFKASQSRVQLIHNIAMDSAHKLHYVAAHYLFLMRANMASVKF